MSLIFVASLFIAGFVYFVSIVPVEEPGQIPVADGIVVLTGAAKRIEKASEILSKSEAKRLLISGVNSATKSREIKELKKITPDYKECCVDLGYQARNTIDNAVEARKWAIQHGMKSLILVTSNYHMSRSLQELQLVSPEINFIPYPVVDKKVQIKYWWKYPGTRSLLFREYFKYILSLGRWGLVTIGVNSSLLTTEPHLSRD